MAELTAPATGRFIAEKGASYETAYVDGTLELNIEKKNLFAWSEARLYRYADFVVEGEFEFSQGSGNGHRAAGFIFRFADEGNFYSALVSSHGYFRVDSVFNGSPHPLIEWSPLADTPPEQDLKDFSLRVIARGDRITIMVDGIWVGEAVDDVHRRGLIAFAAQNYGEMENARFRLLSCFMESRPLEVETWFFRHAYEEITDQAARFRLARTFFAMGEWLAAAVQIRKIEKQRPLGTAELFLKAETSIRLELYDEAETALRACLATAPAMPEAIEEMANLLYLRGHYPELRDYAATILAKNPDNARVWNLSGHARFNLGDFIGAAADYARAAAVEPGQPLFKMNEARAFDQARDKDRAADAYLAAAHGFYEAEADDDFVLAAARLSALRPRGTETQALKAKALFRSGKKEEARKIIERILLKGSDDSALYYLAGILESERGEREKALGRFERALELEPDCALYAFRRAEALMILERPEAAEATARALELDPEDGWIRNLAGMAILAELASTEDPLDGKKVAVARAHLEAARAALPEAPEPAINLAELESREGRLEETLAILAAFPESAAARNQAGNLLSRAAESARNEALPGQPDSKDVPDRPSKRDILLERAAREYESASLLEPARSEYHTNLAACYLELELYSDAEERIGKALDLGPDSRSCLLAGNLASIFGDTVRAETAYRLGLESAPSDPALLFALGRNWLQAGKIEKVRTCIRKLMAIDRERGTRLDAELLEATSVKLSCASCGRVWRIPRTLPPQNAANIRGMPPDDSPAGACPTCGRVFCISCRKDSLSENRFTCGVCGTALKLSDDRLRWLVREHLKRDRAK